MKLKTKIYELSFKELGEDLGLYGEVTGVYKLDGNTLRIEVAFDKEPRELDEDFEELMRDTEALFTRIDILTDEEEISYDYPEEDEK